MAETIHLQVVPALDERCRQRTQHLPITRVSSSLHGLGKGGTTDPFHCDRWRSCAFIFLEHRESGLNEPDRRRQSPKAVNFLKVSKRSVPYTPVTALVG
jgi:hypothetical protein